MSSQVSLNDIGRRLKQAATEAGLTLKQLGDLMEVSRPTIYAYASGALRMSEDRLVQAAKILGKPLSYFEPKAVEDLDPRSPTAHSIQIVDALLSPANPQKASKKALEALSHGSESDPPAIRGELYRRSGNALALAGDYVTSVRHLESALDLLTDESLTGLRGSCHQTLGFCCTNLGLVEEAKEHFEKAETLLPEGQKWKAEVSKAALAERIGEFEEAENRLSQLLDRPDLSDTALAYVRANYASIVCTRGRWRSGLTQTETALHDAYQNQLTDQVAELLAQSALALTYMGRLEEATVMAVRARDVTFTLQDDARSALVDLTVANLVSAYGDIDDARVLANSAYSRAMEGQYRRSESLGLAVLTELALKRGDWQSARESSHQLRSHGVAHSYVVAQTLGHLYEATALAMLDMGAEAHELLQTARQYAEKIGEGRIQGLLLMVESLLARRSGDLGRSDALWQESSEIADDVGLVQDRVLYASLREDRTETVPSPDPIYGIGHIESSTASLWTRVLTGKPLTISTSENHTGRIH